MRNGTGNRRQIEIQAAHRRRKRLQGRMLVLILAMILIMFALRIRELSTCLTEVQTTLQRIEALQHKADKDGAADDAEVTGVLQTADYISRIKTADVGRPVKRTREEAVQKLNELGKTDPVIAKISREHSMYPENMLIALANNPEMADFVSGYPDSSGKVTGGLSDLEKKQDFPLFLQWDPRWGYCPYGTDSNIGLSGCGPTCMSMVLYYLTDNDTLTPDRIADYAMSNGYYVEGTGTAWAFMKDVPGLYGIRVTEPEMSEYAWREALEKGHVLICTMSAGDFTVAGHFIVIYGYDGNGFMVNDPNCVARSKRRWTFDEIRGQMKMAWSYGRKGEQFEEEQVVTFVDVCG